MTFFQKTEVLESKIKFCHRASNNECHYKAIEKEINDISEDLEILTDTVDHLEKLIFFENEEHISSLIYKIIVVPVNECMKS